MGWVWHDDDDDADEHEVYSNRSSNKQLDLKSNNGNGDLENPNRSDYDGCSIAKTVTSKCHTEEIEPGKFVRKCHKTEELVKNCLGRPAEVVKSNTEYTEEDVTNEMTKGRSFSLNSSEDEPFNFPGLRSDIESIERGLFGGLRNFFEAAEELKNGFFQSFGAPDGGSSTPFGHGVPPPLRRRIPVEGSNPKQNSDGSIPSDFAKQMRDV